MKLKTTYPIKLITSIFIVVLYLQDIRAQNYLLNDQSAISINASIFTSTIDDAPMAFGANYTYKGKLSLLAEYFTSLDQKFDWITHPEYWKFGFSYQLINEQEMGIPLNISGDINYNIPVSGDLNSHGLLSTGITMWKNTSKTDKVNTAFLLNIKWRTMSSPEMLGLTNEEIRLNGLSTNLAANFRYKSLYFEPSICATIGDVSRAAIYYPELEDQLKLTVGYLFPFQS